MSDRDPILERTACPACHAERGRPCRTFIGGVDMQWTHDARFYADLRVSIAATTEDAR